MEITSPKLTRANELNSSVSPKLGTESPSRVGSLELAGNNNREAAIEISKLTTDPKTAAVADENRAASRIKPEEVDAFAASLVEKITTSPPKQAIDAAASPAKMTTDLVRSLLS